MDLAAWAEVYMVINLTQFKLLLALILLLGSLPFVWECLLNGFWGKNDTAPFPRW